MTLARDPAQMVRVILLSLAIATPVSYVLLCVGEYLGHKTTRKR